MKMEKVHFFNLPFIFPNKWQQVSRRSTMNYLSSSLNFTKCRSENTDRESCWVTLSIQHKIGYSQHKPFNYHPIPKLKHTHNLILQMVTSVTLFVRLLYLNSYRGGMLKMKMEVPLYYTHFENTFCTNC